MASLDADAVRRQCLGNRSETESEKKPKSGDCVIIKILLFYTDANETASSRRASDIAFGNVVVGGGTTGDRRPSDPLHRHPNLSPIQPRRLAYIILLLFLPLCCIASRVCYSPPVTAPTSSPEEVLTTVGTSESVEFETKKKNITRTKITAASSVLTASDYNYAAALCIQCALATL